MNGWGIHRIEDIYHPGVGCGLPDGRYVAAVCEPYTAGRLKAAWAVFTGKAYAFEWPAPGDLEAIWTRDVRQNMKREPRSFVAVVPRQNARS